MMIYYILCMHVYVCTSKVRKNVCRLAKLTLAEVPFLYWKLGGKQINLKQNKIK